MIRLRPSLRRGSSTFDHVAAKPQTRRSRPSAVVIAPDPFRRARRRAHRSRRRILLDRGGQGSSFVTDGPMRRVECHGDTRSRRALPRRSGRRDHGLRAMQLRPSMQSLSRRASHAPRRQRARAPEERGTLPRRRQSPTLCASELARGARADRGVFPTRRIPAVRLLWLAT